MGKIIKIDQITNKRFLNFFDLTKENKHGDIGHYYMASRAKNTDELRINTKEKNPDAVIIFAVSEADKDAVVLIRQYRYAIGDYVYEMPAGLVDEGETYKEAAIRELKEETGLNFTPLDVNPMYERSFYSSVGMTDESCAMVYGYASGKVDLSGLGNDEDIKVILVDRKEAKRILAEENVSIKCAYQLMHFINSEDVFKFLESNEENK